MGTNYYLKCRQCGSILYHIGKQSTGWNFSSDYTEEDRKYTWLQFRSRISHI